MKCIAACILLAVAAQAASWNSVLDLKPIRRTVPSLTNEPLETSSRIIGGDFATVGQFPYQVGLRIDNAYFCGGSLIEPVTVLTAAHCADGFLTWDVHAGALNFTDETEAGRVVITTTTAQVHEAWGPVLINNDIAVLRLPTAAAGPNIGTVRLPSWSMESNLFVNETVRVSGWGKPSDASAGISDMLKFVDVEVITNEQCANWYGVAINPSNICTGTNNGTEATCSGDSGGPLVYYETDGLPTEIGIVSFGSSVGCESRFPSAFTRVTSYLGWLQNNTNVVIRP